VLPAGPERDGQGRAAALGITRADTLRAVAHEPGPDCPGRADGALDDDREKRLRVVRRRKGLADKSHGFARSPAR
jgi:hypothetical protein